MSRYVLVLVVCWAVVGGGGCILVDQKPFTLTPDQKALVVKRFGKDLSAVPPAELAAFIEKSVRVGVSEVQLKEGKIVVTPQPAILDIAEQAGPSIIDAVVANPTPAAIVTGVLALAGVSAQVIRRRKDLKKQGTKNAR